MASSSSSPCAACKFLRRKCTAECVFAPYFPPDQPQKFASVHKIFGASNITKLLNELPQHQREDAVNSLAYEADARVKDPVYGCVGAISILQRQVAQLQKELAIARSDLARYAGAGIVQASSSSVAAQQVSVASPSLGIGMGLSAPTAREQILAREQLMEPVTREQILEYARAGGSYESLAAMGLAVPLATHITSFPHSRPRPGGDVGGASSAGGSGSPMGHFKMEPSP